jgi:hypothetical protein
MTVPTRPLTLAGLSVTSLSVTTDASDRALGNKRRNTVLMVGDVDDVLGEVFKLSWFCRAMLKGQNMGRTEGLLLIRFNLGG